jgi:hypothetical protein
MHSSLVILTKLIPTSDAIYVIGVAKSTASYTLHVTTLSPSTGEVIKSAHVASSIVDPLTQFISLTRAGLSQPMILWLEQGTLRYIGLTPSFNQKGKPLKGMGYAKILDVGLDNHGQAVIVRNDGSSFILRLDGEIGLAKSIWEFQDSVGLSCLDHWNLLSSAYTGYFDGQHRLDIRWWRGCTWTAIHRESILVTQVRGQPRIRVHHTISE